MKIWYFLKFSPSERPVADLVYCRTQGQTEYQWIARKAHILSGIAIYLTQPIVWALCLFSDSVHVQSQPSTDQWKT